MKTLDRHLGAFGLLGMMLLLGACQAQPPAAPSSRSVPAGPEKSYDRGDWQNMWEQGLAIEEGLERFLQLRPIEAGQTVADIGCGSGVWSTLLAQQVGADGRVYAVDIDRSALSFFADKLQRDENLDPNGVITLVLSQPDNASLPPRSIDVGLMMAVHFHNETELDEAGRRMIASVFEATRPGGWLVIEELASVEGREIAPSLIRHYQDAGFRLDRPPPFFTGRAAMEQLGRGEPNIFVALFQRPASGGLFSR